MPENFNINFIILFRHVSAIIHDKTLRELEQYCGAVVAAVRELEDHHSDGLSADLVLGGFERNVRGCRGGHEIVD